MAGLPEQSVEVIDKARILDDLGMIAGVEAFDIGSDEQAVKIAFCSERVGALAAAEVTGSENGIDSRYELRAVLNMPESPYLYGILRVSHHDQPGHIMGLVQMGAHNNDTAKAWGVIDPRATHPVQVTDNAGTLRTKYDKGSVAVDYHNSMDSQAGMEVYMRPASTGVTELLAIPGNMWIPDQQTDQVMEWMVAAPPVQG